MGHHEEQAGSPDIEVSAACGTAVIFGQSPRAGGEDVGVATGEGCLLLEGKPRQRNGGLDRGADDNQVVRLGGPFGAVDDESVEPNRVHRQFGRGRSVP